MGYFEGAQQKLSNQITVQLLKMDIFANAKPEQTKAI